MKLIPLSAVGKENPDHYAIVDDDIYELYGALNWLISNSGYVTRTLWDTKTQKTGKSLHLHRLIMNPPTGMFVDHINGNRLDNQRSNLRVCTRIQNSYNIGKRKGKNKYKGVQPVKSRINPWSAFIRSDRKIHYLGVFPTEELAAEAYNLAAIKHHGEFARLNVIE